MTDQPRRRNIAEALARADQALKVADAVLGLGIAADAISRAYYAVFHFLRALLFARGLEPRMHSGAQHLFNQEFVTTGEFSSRHNRLLASLQRQRELADYDPAMVFDPTDVSQQITDVRAFGTEVRNWLRSAGLSD